MLYTNGEPSIRLVNRPAASATATGAAEGNPFPLVFEGELVPAA